MRTAAYSGAVTIHRDMITTGGADAVGIQVANNTNAATIVSNS